LYQNSKEKIEKVKQYYNKALGLNLDTSLAETDTQLLTMKVQNSLMVLADYRNLKEEGKSRYSYVEDLRDQFCKLYGYNADLMELLMNIFSPHEVFHF